MTNLELLERLLDALTAYLTDSAKPGHGEIAARHANELRARLTRLEPLAQAARQFDAESGPGIQSFFDFRNVRLRTAVYEFVLSERIAADTAQPAPAPASPESQEDAR